MNEDLPKRAVCNFCGADSNQRKLLFRAPKETDAVICSDCVLTAIGLVLNESKIHLKWTILVGKLRDSTRRRLDEAEQRIAELNAKVRNDKGEWE